MSQKQQFMSQKQQNQETQNQQQQFRNPIFLSKQSQEKTMKHQQQMSQKQLQTTLQKQQSQGTENQQFRKPTWRPNVYDPFGNFPYYRMDVDRGNLLYGIDNRTVSISMVPGLTQVFSKVYSTDSE